MNDTIKFLSTIGGCHRQLWDLAIRLREIDEVRCVKHVVYMPDLADSYRLEQFVDAELVSGDAISWCLEITMTASAILVEADVRKVHSEGEDTIEEVGEYEYSTETECSAQLPEIAERLCSINPLRANSP